MLTLLAINTKLHPSEATFSSCSLSDEGGQTLVASDASRSS
jgi:hypothetical protein